MSRVDIVDDLERDAYSHSHPGSVQAWAGSYTEIRNLVWIKDPATPAAYKEALEEWERKSKLFASGIERKTKQSESLKNENYNLVGFYSVFQGVVLTAVSQSQPEVLTCKKFWIPLILSALASVVTLVGLWQKHQKIQDLEFKTAEDNINLREVTRQDRALRTKGKDFRFADFSKEKDEKGTPKRTAKSMYFVLSALLSFALFFPFSHWWLLCMD